MKRRRLDIQREEDQATIERDLSLAPLTLRIDAGNVNREERSVELILLTENGVDVYDWQTDDIIREVILVSGVEWPKQVPLLDSHSRWSTSDTLGSIRNFSKSDNAVSARAYFSRKQKAVETFDDVADGHITDASVGAKRLATVFIPKGETQTVGGKEFTGPTRVVTRSRILEGSVVAIGADPKAKFSPVQRAYMDPQGLLKERRNMDEYRQLCIERGMPAEFTDEQMREWAKKNLVARAAAPATPPATPPARTEATPATTPATSADDVQRQIAEAAARAQDAEINRQSELRDLVRMSSVEDPDALIADLIKRKVPVDKAASEILRAQAADPGAGPIEPSGDMSNRGATNGRRPTIQHQHAEADSLRKALADGLMLRSHGDDIANAGKKVHYDPNWKPHAGANEFRGRRLVEIGRMLLERAGVKHSDMPDTMVAMRMLGHQDPSEGIYRADGPMYNVSGMFSAVTMDVAHNALRKSYMEAPQTFTLWARRGENLTDFKDHWQSILGEIPDPPAVPENETFKEVTYSDAKEGYKVEVYALKFSITMQAIMNNSLNAFNDAPRKMGSAFRRKNNKIVVGVLTANDVLQQDGVALFDDSTHHNTGTGAAISETSLDEMYSKMMLQTGLDTSVITGFTPRHVLIPPGISGAALKFFGSTSVAIATEGNSNTTNIYGPGGNRQLTPLVEPQLAANDVNAWYGVASSDEVDTVVYAYLDGFELPIVVPNKPFDRFGVEYAVIQGFAAKALDYRGLFRNLGPS